MRKEVLEDEYWIAIMSRPCRPTCRVNTYVHSFGSMWTDNIFSYMFVCLNVHLCVYIVLNILSLFLVLPIIAGGNHISTFVNIWGHLWIHNLSNYKLFESQKDGIATATVHSRVQCELLVFWLSAEDVLLHKILTMLMHFITEFIHKHNTFLTIDWHSDMDDSCIL